MSVTTEEYIELFNSKGTKIPTSREDLLRIERRSRNAKLYRRVTANKHDTYWLVSSRPGMTPMLLQITLSRHISRAYDPWGMAGQYGPVSDTVMWSVSFDTTGIALYPDFNIETVVAKFRNKPAGIAVPNTAAWEALARSCSAG